MIEKRWHRPSIVGPAVLIFIGAALLLGNLGMLHVNWWDLVRLWPVLLILAGLDILARHSRWGSAVVVLITLGALAGLFYVMVSGVLPQSTSPWPFFVGTSNATRQVDQVVREDLAGAKQVDVDLRMGLGNLQVEALDDSTKLLEGSLSYPEGWAAPTVSYRVSGDVGRLTLDGRNTHGWVFPFTNTNGESWALGLSREVPLNIRVDAGASSTVLDLRHLQLRELSVSGGVGRLEAYFPSEGERMTASIDGGVGEVVLHVPESVAARVTVRGGLGGTSFSDRFTRVDDHTRETAGYNGAANRLEIRIDGGLGSLRVE